MLLSKTGGLWQGRGVTSSFCEMLSRSTAPPLIRGAINVPLHPHQTNVFLKLLARLGPTDLCCGQLAHLIERRQLEAMPRRMAPSVRCSSKQCERRITRHKMQRNTSSRNTHKKAALQPRAAYPKCNSRAPSKAGSCTRLHHLAQKLQVLPTCCGSHRG